MLVDRFASCDWKIFNVHYGSHFFHCVGGIAEEDRRLDEWQKKGSDDPFMRQEKEGNIWGWNYRLDEENPDIWVIRNKSTNEILFAYESETSLGNPLVSESIGHTGTLINILPSNSEIVQAVIPLDGSLDELSTIVDSAPSPSWVAGTIDEDMTNSQLLKSLFIRQQAKHAIPMRVDMVDVGKYDQPVGRTFLYALIWLRCASSILMDHGDLTTCIPLLKNRCTIDGNGHITIS